MRVMSIQKNPSLTDEILIVRFTFFIMMIKANSNSNNVIVRPPQYFPLKLECQLQREVQFHLSPCEATVCLLSITSAGH